MSDTDVDEIMPGYPTEFQRLVTAAAHMIHLGVDLYGDDMVAALCGLLGGSLRARGVDLKKILEHVSEGYDQAVGFPLMAESDPAKA